MESVDSSVRLDKTAMSVQSLHTPPDDRAYWHAQTPAARLAAVELQRQIIYGYDPATARLQRVFEVAPLKQG